MMVGIKGYELYIVALQEELYSDEAAQFMIDQYQVDKIFQFDSGGSVTMLTSRGNYPQPTDSSGPSVEAASIKRDISPYVNKDQERFYRPIPTFLAIKVKPNQ